MGKRWAQSAILELMLLTAIATLGGCVLLQAFGLVIVAWRNRPQPGIQVCQRYVDTVGGGANAAKPQADCLLHLPTQVNYLLYLPPTYSTSSKWPLVVYLHGSGHRGSDVNVLRHAGPPKYIEQGKQLSFILVTPQCSAGSWWNGELIVDLIEHVTNSLSVDRDRVYLTGYSMGGSGAWVAACCDPNRFAAIAPLCGRGDPSQAAQLANVPIWAFHGAKDRTVPLAVSATMVDAVRKHGGRVKFTVYPDFGHGICDETYEHQPIFEWLLAQRRSRPPQPLSTGALSDSESCVTGG